MITTKTTYTCDRCNNDFDSGAPMFHIKKTTIATVDKQPASYNPFVLCGDGISMNNGYDGWHLCGYCKDKLEEFMSEFKT